MAFTVVEQFVEFASPVRNADPVLDGTQQFRQPGFVLTRKYWAFYVPKADLQTYIAKVEEIGGADFVMDGAPAVAPMFGVVDGFYTITGTATKRSVAEEDARISNTDFSFYGIAVLEDDFADGVISSVKWDVPTNAGNAVTEAAGVLKCASTGGEYGWVVSKVSYPLEDTRVAVKVTQHNVGGRLQVSPSRVLTAVDGLTSETDWYEARLLAAGQIQVYRRRNATTTARSAALGPFTAPYSMRFQVVGSTIHLMVLSVSSIWDSVWSETFDLDDVVTSDPFYVALCAENTTVNGESWFDDAAVQR